MFKGVCRYDTGIESIAQMIDTVMNCLGVFKEVPIINTAIAAYKETQNLINKHNLIKLKNFIDSLNDGLVADEELKTHIQGLLVQKEVLNQEMEYVLVVLERQLEYNKSSILAKFYLKYLKGEISWTEFVEYSAILERLILSDASALWQCNNSDGIRYEDSEDIASVFRLLALGLVYMPAKNTWGDVGRDDKYKDFKPTIVGRKFIEIMNL